MRQSKISLCFCLQVLHVYLGYQFYHPKSNSNGPTQTDDAFVRFLSVWVGRQPDVRPLLDLGRQRAQRTNPFHDRARFRSCQRPNVRWLWRSRAREMFVPAFWRAATGARYNMALRPHLVCCRRPLVSPPLTSLAACAPPCRCASSALRIFAESASAPPSPSPRDLVWRETTHPRHLQHR